MPLLRTAAWPLLLWCLLYTPALPAQYHLAKTYTVQDGMPMTEVGRCFMSKAGYLYLTSTAGHRIGFDGFGFQEFSKDEVAQNSGDNQGLLEDQYGVWMRNGRTMYWYKKDKEIKIEIPAVKSWFLDENDNQIVLISRQGQLLFFNPENERFEPDASRTYPRSAFSQEEIYSPRVKFGKYWELITTPGQKGQPIYEYETGENPQRRQLLDKVQSFYPLSANEFVLSRFSEVGNVKESKIHLFHAGQLTPLEGKDWKGRPRQFVNYQMSVAHGRVFLYGSPPSGITLSKEDFEIWEVTSSGQAVFHARFQLSAPLNSITVQPDDAGNFWLPSQGGLIKVFPALLGCFESNLNMAGGLHAISEDAKGNIWFGFYRHGFAQFDGDQILPVTPQIDVPSHRIMPGSWRDEAGYMYFFNEVGYGFLKTNGEGWKGVVSDRAGINLLTGGYFYPLAEEKQLAFGLFRNLGIGLMDYPFEPGKPMAFIDSAKGMNLENVITITQDLNQRIWAGRASQGISIYDPQLDTAVTWEITDKGGIGAMSALADSRGNLWLGTKQGLVFLAAPHEFDFLHHNVNDHIEMLFFAEAGTGMITFLKEHQGYLCFGNNIGFGLLDLNSFYRDPQNPRLHFFNTTNYLPGGSSEQNAVHIDREGHIWMGNDQGAIRLDLDRLMLDTSPIHLDTLFFMHGRNDRSTATDGLLKLPRGQRNLSFYWSSTSDRQLTPNRWLSYHLILASGDTLQRNEYLLQQRLNLGYIPAGNHQLELALYKDNQIEEKRTIRLSIPKNLEDTWWFWALISGFLLLAGGVILWLVYTKKRQQQKYELATEKLKREKEEQQVRAITSSLNPHFLNNTLHLVQAKLRNDEIASEAIGKLAENIRAVFQKSRKSEAFHSLKEEMTLVQNYLSIQARRFEGQYRFLLPSEEELLHCRHIMVPLMQILIHTENAIERGLRNRKGSTFLRIALEDDGPHLKIIVEDDGIGYSNAIKKNFRGTQQGTRMLDSLHEIFNARNVRKIISTIEDNIYIDPETGQGYGTRINILIPKRFNYELETDRGTGGRR